VKDIEIGESNTPKKGKQDKALSPELRKKAKRDKAAPTPSPVAPSAEPSVSSPPVDEGNTLVPLSAPTPAPVVPPTPGQPIQDFPAPCLNVDSTWTIIFDPSSPVEDDIGFKGRCDDCSSKEIMLPFTFSLFGQTYNSVYINMNGNLSFGQMYSDFTSVVFPTSNFVMVAPFWADVDNRGAGEVYFKQIGSTAFAVAWVGVGYFSNKTDKLNTFQVVISDGSRSVSGSESANICFCYGDMQWTTGDADNDDANGFGGNPATVGANRGVRLLLLLLVVPCIACMFIS
jgi:hypothetical protein